MLYSDLPSVDEIFFAMSDPPLGEGEEAKVYKVHTNPKYTVRVSHHAPALDELRAQLSTDSFHQQHDLFDGRNFAQAYAWWGKDSWVNGSALITINLYSPGFSLEVHKAGQEIPGSEHALIKTRVLSETIVNMSNAAIDKLYDDMHFLTARHYSLDVGGDLFQNTGNILYSAVDDKAFIIDLQPVVQTHPGIPENHDKGFNMPFYLARGLLPGVRHYAATHAKDARLIELRTEIIEKIIAGAERNHFNDLGGYLGNDVSKIALFWQNQLNNLRIPEKWHANCIHRICHITHQEKYPKQSIRQSFIQVSGKERE